MKKIKLPASAIDTIISEEQARSIIADLQAQLDAPDVPEFWEGQLVEVRKGENSAWFLSVFDSHHQDRPGYHRARAGKELAPTSWPHCRPLQDPLILQFKPHKPGDPMPCDEYTEIRVITHDGDMYKTEARLGYWYDIIGWMPADGWGGE